MHKRENKVKPIMLTPDQLKMLDLRDTDGRFFGAVVEKRDGETREFNARIVPDSFSARDVNNNMVTVWDAKAGGYRTISLEGLKRLRFKGMDKTYPKPYREIRLTS
jgi:hypothetical protein